MESRPTEFPHKNRQAPIITIAEWGAKSMGKEYQRAIGKIAYVQVFRVLARI